MGALAAALLLSSAAARAAPADLLAFPGAQGFGATSRGGRGGDVYRVTTLADDGPGSLRHGIATADGPRTVVFEVGGTIRLRSRLRIRGARLTVAGQTAPGGIGLRGYPLEIVNAEDVVVRHLRVRPGDEHAAPMRGRPGRGAADLGGGSADAVHVRSSERVILDHVSAAWGMDETLSVTGSRDVTVQHSLVAESLHDAYHPKGPHGYGSLVRGGRVSLVGNLFAHHHQRSPGLGGDQNRGRDGRRGGLDADFVNNVVYDWGVLPGHTVGGTGRMRLNHVGNVLVAGPSSLCVLCVFTHRAPRPGDDVAVHPHDDWSDPNRDGRFDPIPALAAAFAGPLRLVAQPFAFERPPVEALPAREAWDLVLRGAGASLARDAVDRRVVRQVEEGGGAIVDSPDDVGGWPEEETRRELRPDADGDGLPDAWERARGLDPDDPVDARAATLRPPWTNLEAWLAERALAADAAAP